MSKSLIRSTPDRQFAGKANEVKKLEVSNITTLTNREINNLKVGSIVVKKTGNQKHTYVVSYKEDKQGICLTYTDASVVETVSYDYTDGNWVYNSTDVTPLGGGGGLELVINSNENIDVNTLGQKAYFWYNIDSTRFNQLINDPVITSILRICGGVGLTGPTNWNGASGVLYMNQDEIAIDGTTENHSLVDSDYQEWTYLLVIPLGKFKRYDPQQGSYDYIGIAFGGGQVGK